MQTLRKGDSYLQSFDTKGLPLPRGLIFRVPIAVVISFYVISPTAFYYYLLFWSNRMSIGTIETNFIR